ncbi:hypothetical protein WJX77_012413 [Trebouxia sp. C0004]
MWGAMKQQGRDLVSEIDNATRQIESIADLKRLGAHEEVKVFWQKAEAIMAKVDWGPQNKTLDGFTKLTRTYTALEFADFYSALPRLTQYTEKAKSHAKKAASSLGEAAELWCSQRRSTTCSYTALFQVWRSWLLGEG